MELYKKQIFKRLPRISENYNDIKKIIATLSAYCKRASDKVQFNNKMLSSTTVGSESIVCGYHDEETITNKLK